MALCSSLPQGNVNSGDRGSSSSFSATQPGEQDTGLCDVTCSFMSEPAVTGYHHNHNCSQRPALLWDKNKSAINDC